MSENAVSAVFTSPVKPELTTNKDSLPDLTQLNLLGMNLETVLSTLIATQSKCDGAFFYSLSRQEARNLQNAIIQIDHYVGLIRRPLELLASDPNMRLDLNSQKGSELGMVPTDDNYLATDFFPSPRTPSTSIDVLLGGSPGAGAKISSQPNYIVHKVEKPVGSELNHDGNESRPSIAPSKYAASLFKKSGPMIHPGSTAPLNTNEKLQKKQVKFELDSGEGWIKSAMDAFKLIDVNNDGFLQKEEVCFAIKELQASGGIDLSSNATAMAEDLMKEVDENGDGEIDINEFIEMMKKSFCNAKEDEDEDKKGGASTMAISVMNNHRMSQLARNVLLAHQVKVENSVSGRDLWLIHPLGKFNVYWNILVTSFIAVTVITVPLSLGWDALKKSLLGFHLTIDAFFFIDVWKNFITGLLDENDKIIMDAKLVRWKYFSHYFLTDFISSIPMDLFLATRGKENSLVVTIFRFRYTLRMAKLFRLEEVWRLTRASHMFDSVNKIFVRMEEKMNFHIPDGYAKLLRLGFGALLLGHWIGCLNFMLVRLYGFPSDSWVVAAGIMQETVFVQWSWSFFKALAQMVMIGFQTPPFTNASCLRPSKWCTIEHWVTLGCLYVGALFYSLLISSMSSILESANMASQQFQLKLAQMEDYMRNKKLPPALREKVKEYFHMQHSEGKLYDESEILETITPIMRREIQAFNGRAISTKVPMLNSITNRSFAEEIAIELRPSYAFNDEILIKENTVGKEMYFILNGIVELFVSRSPDAPYITIGDGCYFGEVALILGCRRTATAKTKTQCVLYTLNRERLLEILGDYPATSQYMRKIAASRQRRVRHFLNPTSTFLAPEDEIDLEDSKTELVGVAKSLLLNKKLQSKNML